MQQELVVPLGAGDRRISNVDRSDLVTSKSRGDGAHSIGVGGGVRNDPTTANTVPADFELRFHQHNVVSIISADRR